MRMCRFAKSVFFTDLDFSLDGIEAIKIPSIQSKQDYSKFILKDLNRYIQTDFVLLIQYDGFVVNADAWFDEFLQYDYIGAKWHWYKDGLNVGNGGFSLRSKKLLEALSGDDVVPDSLEYGEDSFICRTYRIYLETQYGIKYAPESVADKFSFERSEPYCRTFGFHGLFNMWRFIKSDKLEKFLNLLSPRALNSIEAQELGINYQIEGRTKEAEMVYRRILECNPENDKVRSLINSALYL